MSSSAPGSRGGPTYLRIVEEVTASGINQRDLGKVVGASLGAVQSWAAGASVPRGVKEHRLLDVQYIVRELGTGYTDEGVRIWLHSRNRNLDGRRPIDLLVDGDFDIVLREAERVAGAR